MSSFIIVGSGPGGTAAAYRLLQAGHKVTILERGDYLPKEDENRSSSEVYGKTKYRTHERWNDDLEGSEFQPWQHYHVGGNAKLYGAALYRFRPADFNELQYPDGISPAWPLDYSEYSRYYDEAEELYTVRGNRGADSTEPTDRPFPLCEWPDESFVENLRDEIGIDSHPLPLGLEPQENEGWECDLSKFDAYPDPSLSKAEPESRVLSRLRSAGDRFSMRTNVLVRKLEIGISGDVKAIELSNGETLRADCYILAAGAINSAAILIQSGLQERHDLIGANYMAHVSTTGIARFDKDLNLNFAKTFATNQWYQPDRSEPVLKGSIQTQGKWDAEQYSLEEWTRELGSPRELASRAMEFFFMTEDLPLKDNRVSVRGGKISIRRQLTNLQHHGALIEKFREALERTAHFEAFKSNRMPLAWCTHQCGTLVYGDDPERSVLDPDCRLHSADNLYVADSSFFPSSSGLNPTLTIIANALRVGERLGRI